MQLIGYLDSPFVRRVAVSMRFLGIPYEHRELSIFRSYDEFRALHPSVKVPTLVLDDGSMLLDSSLIIAHLEQHVAGRSLMPDDSAGHREATARIGVALAAKEKVAQLIYEINQRPEAMRHEPWLTRIRQQLEGSTRMLESWSAALSGSSDAWMFGPVIGQADVTIAIAWRFMQHTNVVDYTSEQFPALAALSARAEALPEFRACPLAG